MDHNETHIEGFEKLPIKHEISNGIPKWGFGIMESKFRFIKCYKLYQMTNEILVMRKLSSIYIVPKPRASFFSVFW